MGTKHEDKFLELDTEKILQIKRKNVGNWERRSCMQIAENKSRSRHNVEGSFL